MKAFFLLSEPLNTFFAKNEVKSYKKHLKKAQKQAKIE